MKLKTFIVATALTMTSALSVQASCAGHAKQNLSCAAGTTWDAETRSCVANTTS